MLSPKVALSRICVLLERTPIPQVTHLNCLLGGYLPDCIVYSDTGIWGCDLSMNYFAVVGDGDSQIRLHIGKSSKGWCFSLATHEGLNSLREWQDLWETPGVSIEDEYGCAVSPENMLCVITKRRHDSPRSQDDWAAWLQDNHAIEGPNGLARHTCNSRPPEGEPDATYDLISGWFR